MIKLWTERLNGFEHEVKNYISDMDFAWEDFPKTCSFNLGRKYRIKKKTRTINGIEVADCLRVKPEIGIKYFVPDMQSGYVVKIRWENAALDNCIFEAGFCFETKKYAEENYKAIFEPLRIDK